jgi:hypothetical protein
MDLISSDWKLTKAVKDRSSSMSLVGWKQEALWPFSSFNTSSGSRNHGSRIPAKLIRGGMEAFEADYRCLTHSLTVTSFFTYSPYPYNPQ